MGSAPRTGTSFRLLTAAVLLLTVLLGSGCGVKLIYNNSERIARWWVSDYIDMTEEQRAFFDSSTADIMYWHRTTQLVRYETGLLDLAQAIDEQRFDRSELDAVATEVEQWGIAFNDRAVPVARQMLLGLSPEQIQSFERALEKSNRDYQREAERDARDRAKEEAKDYAKLLQRFTGRLNAQQRELINSSHQNMVPDAQVILDYRIYWQQKLLDALTAQPPDEKQLVDLMIRFDEHYTPEFQAMLDANEVIYQDLTLELINGLTAKQRRKLVGELREYAGLARELIEEAPSSAPPTPVSLPAWRSDP